ncbi:MAG: glyoxalase [Acidimicrobiia bacterium]|nr:glyoxalase [Acidimicrobiia bacterium]
MGAALIELQVGDEPAAWQRAGFHVEDGSTWIGDVRLRLVGESNGRGIASWGFEAPPVAGELDGLPVHAATPAAPPSTPHPNGVTGFDHLVVSSPDLDRTIEAYTDAGLELRRTRDIDTPDAPRRQCFFWIGEVILELVGPREPSGDGPSRFFGVACTVADLDATAASLGESCSAPKDAVQPGRRIATLRHKPLGMSVPVAFMSAHVPPAS